MYQIPETFYFLMYADDTTLYCYLDDIDSENTEQILNNELQTYGFLEIN